MFNQKKDRIKPFQVDQQEINTIIGDGFEIKGEVSGVKAIRIEGSIIGNVRIETAVILGEKGLVEGDLIAGSAIIFGTVKGNVKASRLEIKKSGRVEGNIETEIVEIELGAKYNGKLQMKNEADTVLDIAS
ncbi:MAG: polymer-forming cytoskeletal protein [Bacteroidetes bacterium]|nr:polymer-forming cytoskeletal protein [Bacteroidota bacterium]